jgi:hypothetical protein
MKTAREENMGVIATARNRMNWPPKELSAVSDDRFNTLYLHNDPNGFLIGRWIDNNIVKMVSNIHTGADTECVERERRRPRTNGVNKAHVKTVWGDDPVKKIKIPAMIDDYNHNMGGCDVADQKIAYYRPNLRCRRIHTPMFLHGTDLVRINSHVAHDSVNKCTTSQKDYVLKFIAALNDRGIKLRYNRATRAVVDMAAKLAPKERRRRTTKIPTLPIKRHQGEASDHVAIFQGTKQKACIMCSYKRMNDKGSPHKVSYIVRKCAYCDVFLCKACFEPYHCQEASS